MSSLEWESTLAGTIRRAGLPAQRQEWPPAPAGVGHIGPLTHSDVEARRADAEEFQRSWAPVLATQRQIAAEGWPGAMIHIQDTRPPALKALDMAATAAQATVEVAGPGETLSSERNAQERFAAAQERMGDGPGRSVAGPS